MTLSLIILVWIFNYWKPGVRVPLEISHVPQVWNRCFRWMINRNQYEQDWNFRLTSMSEWKIGKENKSNNNYNSNNNNNKARSNEVKKPLHSYTLPKLIWLLICCCCFDKKKKENTATTNCIFVTKISYNALSLTLNRYTELPRKNTNDLVAY